MIIQGTIKDGDQDAVAFFINGNTGEFSQWGAPRAVMGGTVDAVMAMRDALWETMSRSLGDDDAVPLRKP